MTNTMPISRNIFLNKYGPAFEKLFKFSTDGDCIIKNSNSMTMMQLSEMNTTGWTNDSAVFQKTIEFLKPSNSINEFVFTEVESLEKFTQSYIVKLNKYAVEELWSISTISHFNCVCFDESANWCIIFNNNYDIMTIYKSKLI